MAKNSILPFALACLFLFGLANCNPADKKDTPPPKEDKVEPAVEKPKEDKPTEEPPVKTTERDLLDTGIDALINQFNEKLKGVRYPDGSSIEGFEYKKWEIPNRKDFVKWVKVSGAIIKEAFEKLPEGVKLEITGHADTKGPEEKEGKRLGNIFYSTKRSESVRDSLVKLGFPEKRMMTRGAGSSETIPGVDGTSAKNRRVTFKLLNTGSEKPAEEADQGK